MLSEAARATSAVEQKHEPSEIRDGDDGSGYLPDGLFQMQIFNLHRVTVCHHPVQVFEGKVCGCCVGLGLCLCLFLVKYMKSFLDFSL